MRDGFSLANRDLMSHLASEIDSGAIRRVNCTRLLVVARWVRAARRTYLSIKWQCTLSESVIVVTYTVKRLDPRREITFIVAYRARRRSVLSLSLSFLPAAIPAYARVRMWLYAPCARSSVRTRTGIRIAKRCSRGVPSAATSSPRRVYSGRKQMAKISYHSHSGTDNETYVQCC